MRKLLRIWWVQIALQFLAIGVILVLLALGFSFGLEAASHGHAKSGDTSLYGNPTECPQC